MLSNEHIVDPILHNYSNDMDIERTILIFSVLTIPAIVGFSNSNNEIKNT